MRHPTRIRSLVPATVLVVMGAVFSACGSDTGTGNPPIEDVLTTILVSPSTSTLQVGETVQLTARAYNQFGAVMTGVSFTWSSVDDAIVSVNGSTGLATAEAEGSTVVAARSGTVSGGATVEVLPAAGALQVKTQTLPTRPVGVSYSVPVEAVGGEGERTWALVSGSLPSGLSLQTDGLITGTPTTAGTSSFRVGVSDDSGEAEADLEITISEASGTVDLGGVYLGSAYIGVPYTFTPSLSGGDGTYAFTISEGTLPAGLSLNATTGEISGTPTEAGVEFFRLRVESGGTSARRSLSLAVSNRPPDEFNMTVFNVANDPPSERVLNFLSQVVARYEEFISGDIPGDAYPVGSGGSLPPCNGRGPLMDGTYVDDMAILVNIGFIDGVGGVGAFAGPCGLAENNAEGQPVTVFGHLTMDEADLEVLDDHQLFSILWHEIGHIVGIGTLWSSRTAENPYYGQPPAVELLQETAGVTRYIGTNAVREFQALGGTGGYIVVQPTVKGHWDELAYDTEVMTPFYEAAGITQPISAFTIGAFQDFSYEADPSVADDYSVPAPSPGKAPADQEGPALDLSNDITREPMLLRRWDGTRVWVLPPTSTSSETR